MSHAHTPDSPLQIDTSHPVLVTGATGYVAGWVIHRLLTAGVTVHGTVRNPADEAKLAPLRTMAAGLPGQLKFFRADLMDAEAFGEAMDGCRTVFHTASPFRLDVRDAQRDLIEPAREGTRHVLATANQTPSVQRVVLTSSCAAIYGDNADVAAAPGGVLTEAIWNTTSSPTHSPYSYSKTVAERTAWEIASAQTRWTLVVVNPCLVLGPAIGGDATSESFNLMRQFGDGRMKAGVPDFGMGVVDVRDLAEAHVRAAYLPQAAGRYIVAGHNSSLPAIARALLPRFAAYPVPRRILPKWLVWLVAPLADRSMTRRIVSRNVGYAWAADNRKSREELGLTYHPLEVSVQDMFQQMIDTGLLPSR